MKGVGMKGMGMKGVDMNGMGMKGVGMNGMKGMSGIVISSKVRSRSPKVSETR